LVFHLLEGNPSTGDLGEDLLSGGVWVPNWSSTSCNLGVFVYQPAEQITTSQVDLGRRCKWW
jgi:hypothetical protein